jgi:hypothetical protein
MRPTKEVKTQCSLSLSLSLSQLGISIIMGTLATHRVVHYPLETHYYYSVVLWVHSSIIELPIPKVRFQP